MKLLFDHNISPELIALRSDLFPGSNHVYPLNLYEQPDTIVWAYARTHGFIVVSKDADFAEISMVHGFPPKLVWLRLGNCTTSELEDVIRTSYDFIVEMVEDPGRSISLALPARSKFVKTHRLQRMFDDIRLRN